MKRKIRYGNSIIQYSIIKSARRKTSQITVDKDNVLIRTPTSKTLSEIRNIIQSKSQWIFKKQLEYQSQKPKISQIMYTTGTKLPYLGKNYSLKISLNKSDNSITFTDNKFKIHLTQKTFSKKKIKGLYEKWLTKKSHMIFQKKVAKISCQLNVNPRKTTSKKLKDRWGSLTKDDVINLNLNLIKAPSDVIDYIILHELSHMIIKEHNHRFWNLIKKHMPDYKKKINWLEENQNRILN